MMPDTRTAAGTVIAYYLLGGYQSVISSVEPIGAATADPNLPYFILVGMQLELTEDADQSSEIGNFIEGLPSDDATTGLWEFALPIGSYGTVGDPSSVVAPNSQHAPNGEFCWVKEIFFYIRRSRRERVDSDHHVMTPARPYAHTDPYTTAVVYQHPPSGPTDEIVAVY